jgi:hypothetical protein
MKRCCPTPNAKKIVATRGKKLISAKASNNITAPDKKVKMKVI